MKILFIPDSLWGDASGHRSSKYLIKALSKVGIEVGVYAPTHGHSVEQQHELSEFDCKYFPRTDYDFRQQIFRKKVDSEFERVISAFEPDYVFYVGTIKNKTSIDYCIKHDIKYLYLNLTTEYYCINTFAGVEDGPCFACMKGSFFAPLKAQCLPKPLSTAKYIKDKSIEALSKPRIINAHRVVGYSDDQLSLLSDFGVEQSKFLKVPVFFDPDSADGIDVQTGDYFLIFGQLLTAKGFHLIPRIIRETAGVKFKAIIKESVRDQFISQNNLQQSISAGRLEVIDYLPTHSELLDVVARSKGVLIPSYYPTTGEFAMLEALMLGKPTIVFDVGIHKEVFVDGENGMVAAVGDLNGYCRKIELINNDEELYRKVSKGAKELFADMTSFQRFERVFVKGL